MSVWLVFLMCATNYSIGVAIGWRLRSKRPDKKECGPHCKYPCYGPCSIPAHMKEDGNCHTDH